MSFEYSELNPEKKITYEENRKIYKNGFLSTSIMFIKSTVGFGFLFNQYYFGQIGAILGPIMALLITFFIGYLNYLLIKIADEEEKKNNIIETYDQIAKVTFGTAFQYLCKICCFIFNLVVSFVSIINISKYFHGIFSPMTSIVFFKSIFFYKALMIFLILFLLVCIIEPEKMKYIYYITGFIFFIIIIIMWFENLRKKNNNIKPIFYEYFDFSNLPSFIGNQTYCFETVATIFTIRATMEKRSKMKNVLIFCFIIIFILFMINGYSFLLVF